jgi:hypothetical protein
VVIERNKPVVRSMARRHEDGARNLLRVSHKGLGLMYCTVLYTLATMEVPDIKIPCPHA